MDIPMTQEKNKEMPDLKNSWKAKLRLPSREMVLNTSFIMLLKGKTEKKQLISSEVLLQSVFLRWRT